MFGTQQNINQYQKVGIDSKVETANPVELIVMLYDGAILACNSALPHVKQDDYQQRSHYIYKAIRIIQSGLRMSLDHSVDSDFSVNLDALYIYMTNQLVKANIEVNEAPIHEVVKLLKELRTAWQQISQKKVSNQAAKQSSANTKNIPHIERA